MTWQQYSDNRPPGRPAKYPLRKLALGESIFLPGVCGSQIAKRFYNFKPLRFKARTVVSGGVTGARVWRIE